MTALVRAAPRRIAAARSTLVDGVAARVVAEQLGVTRQAVSASVHVMLRARRKLHEALRALAPAPPEALGASTRSVVCVPADELASIERAIARVSGTAWTMPSEPPSVSSTIPTESLGAGQDPRCMSSAQDARAQET